MKYIRLGVAVPLPAKKYPDVVVAVADVCLFDTGDLWRLSHEIRDALGAGA